MSAKSPTAPVHPGEILLEDFMKPAGITIEGLALELCIPAIRLAAIINENSGITADTALRLSRYFSTSSELWMNLQTRYDLDVAADASRPEIERSVQPRSAA